MPDSTLLDRPTNGSLFGQPQPPGPELDSLRTDSAALRPLGDRKISGRTEESLTAAGRRKIWDFATNLHCSIIGTRQDGAKLLHKALDRRHRVSINQFDKAKTAAEVHATWKEAVQRGDIPGAYWAALTHPATNDGLLREIFANVHMLSHLVGAANRADIRRRPAINTPLACKSCSEAVGASFRPTLLKICRSSAIDRLPALRKPSLVWALGPRYSDRG
jgi:hypothetical protein